jgi:hypothetical protein
VPVFHFAAVALSGQERELEDPVVPLVFALVCLTVHKLD